LKFTVRGMIKVSIDYIDSTNTLKFSVRDSGIGIKPEDKAKLFKLFSKLEATASINTTGIGIGLNICKQIVESFGGVIYVEDNRDGPGTTFNFTIKCKDNNIETFGPLYT
jgi:two-component system, NarL family, sensor histidine kinase BarA